LDELSNEVIAGLDWQRAARITITPGVACDLLNGLPVRQKQPASDRWMQQRTNEPIRLAAVLMHAAVIPSTQVTSVTVPTTDTNDRC
jgi:hypothetical protein